MSYLIYVILPGNDGGTNACRYATRTQAKAAGRELLSRWLAPTGFEVRKSKDAVNYRYDFKTNQSVSLESETRGGAA